MAGPEDVPDRPRSSRPRDKLRKPLLFDGPLCPNDEMGRFCKEKTNKQRLGDEMIVNAQKGDVSQRKFSEANRRCFVFYSRQNRVERAVRCCAERGLRRRRATMRRSSLGWQIKRHKREGYEFCIICGTSSELELEPLIVRWAVALSINSSRD